MEKSKAPFIIAISGVSGAGKSTLVDYLQNELNSIVIRWDDFDDISTSPNDYVDWFKRDGSYSEWDYPKLAEILQRLKTGVDVVHPVRKQLLRSTEYIFFDAPLGRCHIQTGKFIDIWVHVSVPMDVSLARRILRDFNNPAKTKTEILDELKYYLESSRSLFIDSKYIEKADLTIDGMKPLHEQLLSIKKFIDILPK